MPHPPDPPSRPAFVQPSLLFDSDGLRSGWGLLLFVLLTVFVMSLTGAAEDWFGLPRARGPGGILPGVTLLRRSVSFASVLLVTFVLARLEGRPLAVYGLGGRHRRGYFLAGAASGLGLLSLLVLLLWSFGALYFHGLLLSRAGFVRYAFEWAAAFLAVSLFEETLLRGYLQFTLARGLSAIFGLSFGEVRSRAFAFWSSAGLLSLLFGVVHTGNAGESPIGLLAAALAGLVFCYSLWRSGSLWWAIGFHAAWDWAQSFLFGVADSGTVSAGRLFATHPAGPALLSGGSTGPEGSLLVFPVLACAAVVVRLTLGAGVPDRAEDATRSALPADHVA